MRDIARSIQARRRLKAPAAYMSDTRSDHSSSTSPATICPTAPFRPYSQSEPSTQSSMPSFGTAKCDPASSGPANWSKVLEVLAQAVASPGTNSTGVNHLQAAILALAAEPSPTATQPLTQPSSDR